MFLLSFLNYNNNDNYGNNIIGFLLVSTKEESIVIPLVNSGTVEGFQGLSCCVSLKVDEFSMFVFLTRICIHLIGPFQFTTKSSIVALQSQQKGPVYFCIPYI